MSEVFELDDEHGYEWVPDEDWSTAGHLIAGRTCRQQKCVRPAAAALNRGRRTPHGEVPSWWCYCDNPKHMYGRRIRDGVVEVRVRVDSPFYHRAKAALTN